MRKKNKDFVVGQCSPCALTSLLLDGVRCCKGERRWGRPDLMDPDGIPASDLLLSRLPLSRGKSIEIRVD